MITDATNLFTHPYSLIRVEPMLLDNWDKLSQGARIIYQCFYPEEMMYHFTQIDDYYKLKDHYYVFDLVRMQLMHCYKDTALRALKRHLKD